MLLLLLVGWIVLAAPFWTLTVLAIITAPAILAAFTDVFRKSSDLPVLLHLRALAFPLLRSLAHVLSTIVFLPYDAIVAIDAITRTLFRMLITRRHLLEWVTASDAQRSARTDLVSFVLSMLATPLLAFAIIITLVISRRASVSAAAPLLALWVCTARYCLVAQPSADPARCGADRSAAVVASANRPMHLALLRGVFHSRRPLSSPRQFSGTAGCRHRSPYFANKHRNCVALGPGGIRFRLPVGGTTYRPHRQNAGFSGKARTLSRPLL